MLKEKEDEFFQEIASSENLSTDIGYIFERKLLIIPFALGLWFLLGFKFGFKDRSYLIAGVFAIAALSLLFVNIIEAISYVVVFLIGNLIMINKSWRYPLP